jgi:hypothetical protein
MSTSTCHVHNRTILVKNADTVTVMVHIFSATCRAPPWMCLSILYQPQYSHFHIMIVFFLAKKENILVPNAVEKHRTGAFRTRDQTLSFFFRLKKKDSHYENESIDPRTWPLEMT